MTNKDPIRDGELAAKISNTVVRALSRTTGRDPHEGKDHAALTACSWCCRPRSHAASKRSLTPARARRCSTAPPLANDQDVSREIEELTGRKVIGFMSDNYIDPDLAVEVCVLEPVPSADTH